MRYILLPFLFFFSFINTTITQTIGTTQITENATDGYTFFSPFSGTKAWMVDNCGHLVNQWDRSFRPGLAAYFLESGMMLRTYKPNPIGPFNSASNSGGLELVDWDNNTVWSYELNNEENISHHDAIQMPNGNFLMLSWELVYQAELTNLGRNPNEISAQGYMWSERIIEVEPIGNSDINIVWEWHITDHYVQDFDSTQLNYGIVSDHPELFDINLPKLDSDDSHPVFDWNHFNAIDYHEGLDQIVISVRNSDEIWIIDHSTTSQEAATHEGGQYGKGGDILYRWGNASAYNRAPISDQKLFGQHGVHWIKEDLVDAGKILIFNNGRGLPGPDFSTIELLEPAQNTNGSYILPDITEPFAPENTEIIYGNLPGENFFSPYLSNAQRLPNGHTLIMVGSPGVIFEIDENREIVWKYIIPLSGDIPGTQGNNVSGNASFRGYKYTPDFAGFNGINIENGAVIENGGNPLDCPLMTAINPIKPSTIEVKFHSTTGQLEILNPNSEQLNLRMIDLSGKTIWSRNHINENYFSEQLEIQDGVYFLQVSSNAEQLIEQVFKF